MPTASITTLVISFVYILVLCALALNAIVTELTTEKHCHDCKGSINTDCLLFVLQVEQVTPDVPLPGLKQKGKEAEAIGKLKGPQSGPGAADQVTFCSYQPCVLHEH